MDTALMDKLTLLQTFPGWPAVTDPSPMFYFMLCFGGPLLCCAIIAALVLGAGRRRQVVEINRAAGLGDDEDAAAHELEQPQMRRALNDAGGSTAAPRAGH